jgi:hypothetical protein
MKCKGRSRVALPLASFMIEVAGKIATALQVGLGGILVFVTGVLIGSS